MKRGLRNGIGFRRLTMRNNDFTVMHVKYDTIKIFSYIRNSIIFIVFELYSHRYRDNHQSVCDVTKSPTWLFHKDRRTRRRHHSIFWQIESEPAVIVPSWWRVSIQRGRKQHYYLIMASFKGKAGNRAEKKQLKKLRSDNRSRVKTTHRKRADTPYRRQPYQSVSIPQLVYELLTIDKYNQGIQLWHNNKLTKSIALNCLQWILLSKIYE